VIKVNGASLQCKMNHTELRYFRFRQRVKPPSSLFAAS
jgi:hypothetical protein